MQHRGTARRRVLIATADGALPPPGTRYHWPAGGRSARSDRPPATKAIAIVRIDQVKAAMDGGMPITAGDATLSLAIPAWARFTFPQDAAARRRPDAGPIRSAAARLAAHAVRPAARPARPLAARHRDHPTSPTGLRASRAGTARPPATMPSRWRSIRCWSRRSFGMQQPDVDRRTAAGGAAARCAGICDRRHDLAVQGGGRRRLQGSRGAAARGHPSALLACRRRSATG